MRTQEAEREGERRGVKWSGEERRRTGQRRAGGGVFARGVERGLPVLAVVAVGGLEPEGEGGAAVRAVREHEHVRVLLVRRHLGERQVQRAPRRLAHVVLVPVHAARRPTCTRTFTCKVHLRVQYMQLRAGSSVLPRHSHTVST